MPKVTEQVSVKNRTKPALPRVVRFLFTRAFLYGAVREEACRNPENPNYSSQVVGHHTPIFAAFPKYRHPWDTQRTKVRVAHYRGQKGIMCFGGLHFQTVLWLSVLTPRVVDSFNSDTDATSDSQTIDKTSLKYQTRNPNNHRTPRHLLCSVLLPAQPQSHPYSTCLLLRYPCCKITFHLLLYYWIIFIDLNFKKYWFFKGNNAQETKLGFRLEKKGGGNA